ERGLNPRIAATSSFVRPSYLYIWKTSLLRLGNFETASSNNCIRISNISSSSVLCSSATCDSGYSGTYSSDSLTAFRMAFKDLLQLTTKSQPPIDLVLSTRKRFCH